MHMYMCGASHMYVHVRTHMYMEMQNFAMYKA